MNRVPHAAFEAARITPVEHAAGIDLIRRALGEDLRHGEYVDLTAVALEGAAMSGAIVARQAGVVCGIALAAATMRMCEVAYAEQLVPDGTRVQPGERLLVVEGAAAPILEAERTALNILQRLSGTATLTRAYVDAVEATGAAAVICDTRKTIPGMRALQRWAVRCGGGVNHRFGLADEAMLKDNHIAACGSIAAAVTAIRTEHPSVRIHVEADTIEQADAAAAAGADVILLDNMSTDELRAAVSTVAGRALTEASGGIDLTTVADVARTGVDRISVGALTHSAPAFDVALDADPVG